MQEEREEKARPQAKSRVRRLVIGEVQGAVKGLHPGGKQRMDEKDSAPEKGGIW